MTRAPAAGRAGRGGPRRVFFGTGEPSGEQLALRFAEALRAEDPSLRFEGFGDRRLAAAGFRLWGRTAGWSSIGPLAALPRIPLFLSLATWVVPRLLADPPDLMVLVDYGAFHLRLARFLRLLGYRGAIVYAFPPGAWSDRRRVARQVAAAAEPLTPFARQEACYAAAGVAATRCAHPLLALYPPRPPRPPAPADGGRLALLPGSRKAELLHHLPVMLGVVDRLREGRPRLEADLVVADPRYAARIRAAVGDRSWVRLVEPGRERYDVVDAALAKSGTVVLETALCDVPTVALYRVSATLAWVARHLLRFRNRFVTLPNLVLEREVVPERLQEAATVDRLAADVEALLREPAAQRRDFAALREALAAGEPLDRWARRTLAALPPRAA